MNMETCDAHDDSVVVYDSRGYSRLACPLCAAEEKIENLKDEVQALNDKE